MDDIVKVPDPMLSSSAKPISVFDARLARLVTRMCTVLRTTRKPKGVGLAGPQIGEPYRIFVTRPVESAPVRVFINPRILKTSDEQTDGVPQRENKLEGCLSVPKIWGKVKRAMSLTLQYQDERGTNHTEHFSGFLATIIQHEMDHINGILFTQRVLEQKGKFYQSITDTTGKEKLEEIEVS